MSWTDVVTRATGYTVTATNWNEFANNFKAIGDAWTSYTPAWTAGGSNPSKGNGTITGAYIQAGNLIIGRVKLVLGSTSTVGSGAYRWSLPTAASASSDMCVGSGVYNDSSGSTYAGTLGLVTSTTFEMYQGGGGSFAAASPVVPASGDKYTFQFCYEAA